jgi:tight adherence protein B
MQGLIFLCVAGSIFFVALVVYGVLYAATLRYREHYVGASVEELGEMFVFVDPRQMFVLNLSLMGLMFGGGLIFFGPVVAVFFAVLGFLTPTIAVRYYRKKRIEKFERQLTDALTAMANAFKAGLNLPQAMEQIAREARPPLSQEFGLVVRELKLGKPVEEALVNLAGRVESEDLQLLVTSTNIARSLGGNMAEMFDTISNTIRERFRLEGKIKAMTSQGKLQGGIVACLPVILGFVVNYMRPDLMEPMLKHWFGWLLLGAGVIMEVLGILIIRRIVNVSV